MNTFTFKPSAGNQTTVNNLEDLSALAREFPGQQKKLFYKAYKFTNRFRDLVDNHAYTYTPRNGGAHNDRLNNFIALAVAFPGQVNELFQLVLAQPNRMQEFARDVSKIDALVAAFPAQRDKLFQLILTDIDHFQVLVKGNFFIFKNICAIFPERKEELCRLLLSDRKHFDAMILSLNFLERLVEDCPNQRELLFQATVEDAVWFNNFVKRARHLTQLAEMFPEHESLLNKPTVEEAFQAIQTAIQMRVSKPEIEKNVTILYELAFRHTKLILPKELVVYIAALTGVYGADYNVCRVMGEVKADEIERKRLIKEATPSVSALIREHGLFMSVIRNNQQPRTDQEQRSFDQQYGLVVRRNSF